MSVGVAVGGLTQENIVQKETLSEGAQEGIRASHLQPIELAPTGVDLAGLTNFGGPCEHSVANDRI